VVAETHTSDGVGDLFVKVVDGDLESVSEFGDHVARVDVFHGCVHSRFHPLIACDSPPGEPDGLAPAIELKIDYRRRYRLAEG
jgi:hypothetical protein